MERIMKVCSKCKILKPEEDYCVDRSKKDGLYSCCKECKNKQNKNYKKNNKLKIGSYNALYRRKNKKRINKWHRLHYIENREVVLAKHKKYRKENPENAAKSSKKYYNKHKAEWYNRKATRRALKNNATISYSDKKIIARIYRTASILSVMLKKKFEVDHIIPLNNPLVCGIHHENNLRIITMKRNRRKSNYFNPEEWEK